MSVEEKSEKAVDEAVVERIKATVTGTAPVLEYLDIAVKKQINNDAAVTMLETANVIEIVVPFTAKAASVTVIRYHGDTAEPLTSLGSKPDNNPADKTFYLGGGYLYIYTQKFSTYAVAYSLNCTVTFDPDGGTLAESDKTASTNSEGKLSSLPQPTKEGYNFQGWYTADGKRITEGYVFTNDATVTARWSAKGSGGGSGGGYTPPSKPAEQEKPSTPVSQRFTDVPAGVWYEDAVQFTVDRGLFNGMTPTIFGPENPMTRGMLATVLYRLEKEPGTTVTGLFSDVAGGEYYARAIAWAAFQGVVGGYGNGLFGPNDDITREQLAVMLWRYSGSPAATHKELHFADVDQTSDWAIEAMRWAVENGIINGHNDGRLDPQGQATRAQVAAMLMRYLNKTEG